MVLIADSGSTKTSWILIDNDHALGPWETIGFNPYFHDESSISEEILQHLSPKIEIQPEEIYFYGSGCKAEENKTKVKNAIQSVFPASIIEVDHDLIGASRSLCQFEAGIVCILGTGSNSCYYDGSKIIQNQTSLGFVLGDEGSGAVLGTELVRNYLYNKLPEELQSAFSEAYSLDPFTLLNQVYRQPFPNRFLAKFTKFLYDHRDHPYIGKLVETQFETFLQRNVLAYEHNDLKVHFMGSVALYFSEILKEVCRKSGIRIGSITNDALPGLVSYYRTILSKTS